jgi:hypothetical protein
MNSLDGTVGDRTINWMARHVHLYSCTPAWLMSIALQFCAQISCYYRVITLCVHSSSENCMIASRGSSIRGGVGLLFFNRPVNNSDLYSDIQTCLRPPNEGTSTVCWCTRLVSFEISKHACLFTWFQSVCSIVLLTYSHPGFPGWISCRMNHPAVWIKAPS